MIFFSVNVTKMLDHLNPGRGTEKPVDPDDPGQKAGSGGDRL